MQHWGCSSVVQFYNGSHQGDANLCSGSQHGNILFNRKLLSASMCFFICLNMKTVWCKLVRWLPKHKLGFPLIWPIVKIYKIAPSPTCGPVLHTATEGFNILKLIHVCASIKNSHNKTNKFTNVKTIYSFTYNFS